MLICAVDAQCSIYPRLIPVQHCIAAPRPERIDPPRTRHRHSIFRYLLSRLMGRSVAAGPPEALHRVDIWTPEGVRNHWTSNDIEHPMTLNISRFNSQHRISILITSRVVADPPSSPQRAPGTPSLQEHEPERVFTRRSGIPE